jgi:mannose-6-phosphate isomerase-like protein (cupin superfamily)
MISKVAKIAASGRRGQIKLAKLEGEFVWHFHQHEDELFFVHRGRPLMKFRDRDEILEEGEFIVVPHGVEHCPVALSDVCEIVLLEPGTTRNTGTTQNERTVVKLGRI